MNELAESQINEIFMYLPTERALIKGVCRYWNFVCTKIQLRDSPSLKLILKHTDQLRLVRSLELSFCPDLESLVFPNLRMFKLKLSQDIKLDGILVFLEIHSFLKGLYLPKLDYYSLELEHAEFVHKLSNLISQMPNLEEISFSSFLRDLNIVFNSLSKSNLRILRLYFGTNASQSLNGMASFTYLESLHLSIKPVKLSDFKLGKGRSRAFSRSSVLCIHVLSAPFNYKLKPKNFPVLNELIVKAYSLSSFNILDTKNPDQWPYLKLKIDDFKPEKIRELESLDCIKQIEHLYLKNNETPLLNTCLLSLTCITRVHIELHHGYKLSGLDIDLLRSGLKQLNHLTDLELSGLKDEQLFTESFPFSLTKLSLSLLMFKSSYYHITNFVLYNCPKLEFLKLISALNDLTEVDLTKINLSQLKTFYTFTHKYNESNLIKLISYLPSLIWVYAFPKTLQPITQTQLPHVYFSSKF